MMKRSIWILMISMLLCLSMLLVSCNSDDGSATDTSDEKQEDTRPESVVLQDNATNYAELINQWSANITPIPTSPAQRTDYTSATQKQDSVTNQRGLFYCTNVNGEISIYNDYREILSRSDVSRSDYTVDYSYDILANGQVVEIEKVVATLGQAGWNTVYSYSYYDVDGEQIGAESETQAVDHGNCIVLGDRSYHMDAGKVFYTAHATETYEHIKEYDFTYETSEGVTYSYSIASWGDNIKVQVFDQAHKIVAEGILNDAYEFYILDNGDLYQYTEVNLGEKATEFDYEDATGTKYLAQHTLISVTTGETKDLDLPFILSKMFTKHESEDTGILPKAGTQYAEIIRIEEGKPALTPAFVMLDNQLGEAVTLPLIFKNQTGVVGSAGNNVLVVEVGRGDGSLTAQYFVNVDTKTVERDAKLPNGATELDGGYIYNGKVYSSVGEEVLDLADVEYYTVESGNLHYWVESEYINYYDNNREASTLIARVGHFNEAGEFVTRTIATETQQSAGQTTVTITNQSMYMSVGEELYLVEETVTTKDMTGATADEVVVNYMLYNRNGVLIQRFHECDDAYLFISGETPMVTIDRAGTETTYIIK